MGYYVYILRSEVDGTYYKGSTEAPVSRLQDHNAGRSYYIVLGANYYSLRGVVPGELFFQHLQSLEHS
ncbi:MAG: GIY-YIG nuclease family protein [Chitinophagaceae bacterium]|nr:GIY-YIG nuclease family protein [Chitinophagaceae bacterium]